MKKPIIKNGSFSVDDIHKIREYHYEATKNLSTDEILKEIKNEAEEVKKEIRKNKKAIV